MANTVNLKGNGLEISDIDSDFSWDQIMDPHIGGFRVHSIQFSPGGAGEACLIRDGAADGPVVYAYDQYQPVKYFDPRRELKPVMLFIEGTFTANSRILFVFGSP